MRKYSKEHSKRFELETLIPNEVFDDSQLQNRTDLRLTLDEPDDYLLLETVYREIEYDGILDVRDAIRYVDENDLRTINQAVEQKSVK